MKKKLLENWGWKLIAFLIAFGLWIMVVYMDNPPGVGTFTDIPVKFLNEDILQDQNQVYEILNDTDEVKKVTVKAPQQVIDEMKNSATPITATADFKNLDPETNTIPIEITIASRFSKDILEVTQDEASMQVELQVESLTSKNVRIRINTTGEIKEGYQLGEAKTGQNMVTVTGAASKVARVSYAAVTQDLAGSDSDIKTTQAIQLYDDAGNLLDKNLVQKSLYSTELEIKVLPIRLIPIQYEVTGVPASGYAATGNITSDPAEISLAGTKTVMDSISEIVVSGDILDISGRNSDLKAEYNIKNYLPPGTQISQDGGTGNVQVTVEIQKEIETQFRIKSERITVENVPDGVEIETAAAGEVYDLIVRGLRADIMQISEDALTGKIDVAQWMADQDMTQIAPGTYYIPVIFELPDGVRQEGTLNAWVRFSYPEENRHGNE